MWQSHHSLTSCCAWRRTSDDLTTTMFAFQFTSSDLSASSFRFVVIFVRYSLVSQSREFSNHFCVTSHASTPQRIWLLLVPRSLKILIISESRLSWHWTLLAREICCSNVASYYTSNSFVVCRNIFNIHDHQSLIILLHGLIELMGVSFKTVFTPWTCLDSVVLPSSFFYWKVLGYLSFFSRSSAPVECTYLFSCYL